MRKFILLFSCAILLGCDKFVVFDYYLRGEFDAVYCYIPEKGIPCKKDTAISFSAEELVLLHLKKRFRRAKLRAYRLWNREY